MSILVVLFLSRSLCVANYVFFTFLVCHVVLLSDLNSFRAHFTNEIKEFYEETFSYCFYLTNFSLWEKYKTILWYRLLVKIDN